MAYRVEVTKDAEKYFKKLDAVARKRFAARLAELAADPFTKSRLLVNRNPPQRASRIGTWRILFEVLEDEKIVLINTIDSRGQVYRD